MKDSIWGMDNASDCRDTQPGEYSIAYRAKSGNHVYQPRKVLIPGRNATVERQSFNASRTSFRFSSHFAMNSMYSSRLKNAFT